MPRLARSPVIFTDGNQMLISIDGQEPRNPEGGYVRLRPRSPLHDQKLRFSVTRHGNLKFAKKVKTYLQFEERVKVDDDGNPVPNEKYQNDMRVYGRSYHKEHETERVPLEEPEVRLSYEVDREWWNRHAVTRVKF